MVERAPRVRASELTGRNWLNTGGKDLNWSDLRGKIVVLDFWSFCCINCLHVLDELRPLEEEFSDILVTVGVHSPKFEHEADPEALAAAVDRYDIQHPVLDDPELSTWQAYTARAWPTLVVVDPEGYIVAHLSGEGHVQGLVSLVHELAQEHEAKGTLHRGSGPYVPRPKSEGILSFPGKINALPAELRAQEAQGQTYLVTDTGRHRVVELDASLEKVLRTWGGNAKGYQDGSADDSRFNEPQGLAIVPEELRAQVGYDVVVADSVNHRLRGVRLDTGEVTTVAGNGVQRLLDAEGARTGDPNFIDPEADPQSVSLSSPWDLVWSDAIESFIVAMAGTHQIFSFDPVSGTVQVLAGTGAEGLLDGTAAEAWFAQSSGLAQAADGTIWVADSETSALRKISFQENGPVVTSAVGQGLFDFGFRDGSSEEARLQHCLGVAVLPDQSVAIADTYNGAVRRWDPATAELTTLARDLAEPSDVLLEDRGEGEEPLLLVVEANAHQVVRLPIPKEAQRVDEGASQTQRPPSLLAGGTLEIVSRFSAPSGQKLDDRWGDPTQLKISATPPEFITEGSGAQQGLARTLTLNPEITDAVLHVTARAAACDGEPGGEIPDHAACHLYQQDWGIPVRVTGDEKDERTMTLDLRGVN
ncbi:NHL domain-containing thioredoxin family protein [Kocuria sp. TGY1127_2]|uniref:NHL domain-containing thioredoxin family protein n=1 Tax=Kocuria sp. TGY1127_2 TaxID=2711328 RepID=UPI0015B8D6A0|nr:NHL domain-containing thioredoxin family protein [Kocuria sp. TGY1127_2]